MTVWPAPLPTRPAAMGGQRGSDGVVPGYTDLGDLRGHPQSGMRWVCETPGWVTVGWPIRAQ
jgi:hypothetical protein